VASSEKRYNWPCASDSIISFATAGVRVHVRNPSFSTCADSLISLEKACETKQFSLRRE